MGLCDAQEVIGDDRSALAAVVAADAELVALREEEAALTARQVHSQTLNPKPHGP